MNNAADATATREEEIAFQIVERVTGATVLLNDAGGGDQKPDGCWEANSRKSVLEVTSPPATELMRELAEAERSGDSHMESGAFEVLHGQIHQFVNRLLAETLDRDVQKLQQVKDADERHLFLFGRGHRDRDYFARVSDQHEDKTFESVGNLNLPKGISDVWLRGRALPNYGPLGEIVVWVARFNRQAGWSRHTVLLDERSLPAPKGIPDKAPPNWRRPRTRSRPPGRAGGLS